MHQDAQDRPINARAVPVEAASRLNPLLDREEEASTRDNVANLLDYLGAVTTQPCHVQFRDGTEEYARGVLLEICAAALRFNGCGSSPTND